MSRKLYRCLVEEWDEADCLATAEEEWEVQEKEETASLLPVDPINPDAFGAAMIAGSVIGGVIGAFVGAMMGDVSMALLCAVIAGGSTVLVMSIPAMCAGHKKKHKFTRAGTTARITRHKQVSFSGKGTVLIGEEAILKRTELTLQLVAVGEAEPLPAAEDKEEPPDAEKQDSYEQHGSCRQLQRLYHLQIFQLVLLLFLLGVLVIFIYFR